MKYPGMVSLSYVCCMRFAAYITVTATASSLKDKSPQFDIDYSLTKTTDRPITTSTALPTIMS